MNTPVSGSFKTTEFNKLLTEQQPLFKANSLRHKDDLKKTNRKLDGTSSNLVQNIPQKQSSQKYISIASSRNLVTTTQASLLGRTPKNTAPIYSAKFLRNSGNTPKSSGQIQGPSVIRKTAEDDSARNAIHSDTSEFKNSRKSVQPHFKEYKPLVDENILSKRGRSLGLNSSTTSRDTSRVTERGSNTSNNLRVATEVNLSSASKIGNSAFLQKIGNEIHTTTNVYSLVKTNPKDMPLDNSLLTTRTNHISSHDRQGRVSYAGGRKVDSGVAELISHNAQLKQEISALNFKIKYQADEEEKSKFLMQAKNKEIEDLKEELKRKGQLQSEIQVLRDENITLKRERDGGIGTTPIRPNGTGSSTQIYNASKKSSNDENIKQELLSLSNQINDLKSELSLKNSMIAQFKSQKSIDFLKSTKDDDYLISLMNTMNNDSQSDDDQIIKQRYIIDHLRDKIIIEENRIESIERDFLKYEQNKINERRIGELTRMLESKQVWINALMAKEGGCKTPGSKVSKSQDLDRSSSNNLRSSRLTGKDSLMASTDFFNFKKNKGEVAEDDVDSSEKIEWYKQMKRSSKLKQVLDFDSRKGSDDVRIETRKISSENSEKSSPKDSNMESRRSSIAQSEESITKIIKQYK